jgi:carbamoyl-phosphate synthase large subunit
MQSVGEAMSIGRTFPESLQKGLRSLEQGRLGLNCDPGESLYDNLSDEALLAKAAIATPERIFQVGEALRRGMSVERVFEATKIDPWFLDQMLIIVDERHALDGTSLKDVTRSQMRRAKRLGFADAQIAYLLKSDEMSVRAHRESLGVIPTYKTVDTCSAEFAAQTPYHYSTFEDELQPRDCVNRLRHF